MRVFRMFCGIAVLFISLHMVHAIEHFTHMRSEMSATLFWGLIVVGVVMDFFSLLGGLLLLTSK